MQEIDAWMTKVCGLRYNRMKVSSSSIFRATVTQPCAARIMPYNVTYNVTYIMLYNVTCFNWRQLFESN